MSSYNAVKSERQERWFQIWVGIFLVWLGIMFGLLWRVVTPSVQKLHLPIWILLGAFYNNCAKDQNQCLLLTAAGF